MNDNAIKILEKLIMCKSVTPNDAGCQEFISNFLKNIGFLITVRKYGEVNNLIARYGSEEPVFAFVGHTDVVPAGNINDWESDPFVLTNINERLYGRGTSDMKGSIACMMVAANDFINKNKNFKGSIIFILTSDEEGPAKDGIKRLIDEKDLSDHHINMCLVGEPSSLENVGDTIKNGRRGSLSAKLVVKGVQGHIAYPQNAQNPIHNFSPILQKLITEKYDKGNKYFPPTSFQVSNLNSGIGPTNVIPGILTMDFNFRYSTETNAEKLKSTVLNILNSCDLNYEIQWDHSGEPYLTKNSDLLKCCEDAIKNTLSIDPQISTDGGTSDGRFMAKICDQVIEFGLINSSIHKVNEHTTEKDIINLTKIYNELLKKIFLN